MPELAYVRCGDYEVPNLKLSNPTDVPIGKYGRMRKHYLKESGPVLNNYFVLSETLFPHLLEIDNAVNQSMEALLLQPAKKAGVTEELKASDLMKWVGLMNALKAQAERIIVSEPIYI